METSVKRSYASVVWSHKIQEKQCDIYTRQYKLLETLNIIAASATSVGILSLIFTNQFWIKIISAILSFVTIFVSAYFMVLIFAVQEMLLCQIFSREYGMIRLL